MTTITQPLRDEHKELFPHIEALRVAADAVSETAPTGMWAAVAGAYDFLTHHLIPHAQAEDKALYPVVQKAMGAALATATMSRDHVEVGQLTAELGALVSQSGDENITADQAKDLRRLLYGLYALVKVHFAKEEEIYLPLLDSRLSPEEAREMFETMEVAAAEAKLAEAKFQHAH